MKTRKRSNQSGFSRTRRIVLVGAAAAFSELALAGDLLAMPPQTAGPFYPRELPLDSDNDLTRIAGQEGRAQGVICDLAGRLLSADGRPVAGARIEIWQCDATGQYHHPADRIRHPRDDAFQGFGATESATDGAYRFRTIRPVSYPGRTPHIHVRIVGDEFEPFISQIYIEGHPGNAEDGLFQRLGEDGQRAASARFEASDRPGAAQQADFDIVMG